MLIPIIKKIIQSEVIILFLVIFLTSCVNMGEVNSLNASSSGEMKPRGNSTNQEVSVESSLSQRMREDEWEMSLIDTGRRVDYLSEEEKDVILATNAVRTDPEKFARLYVLDHKEHFNGKIIQYPGQTGIMTHEGISAVDELYEILIKQRSLSILSPSKGMSLASLDHSKDQAQSGRTGHVGSNGSSPFDRMNRYGKWDVTAGENISYGHKNGLRIVLQLLVDDNVLNRGHRKNILNSQFNVIGVSINTHPVYGFSCVITYAGKYEEPGQ